jgi:hypothetical protein
MTLAGRIILKYLDSVASSGNWTILAEARCNNSLRPEEIQKRMCKAEHQDVYDCQVIASSQYRCLAVKQEQYSKQLRLL